MALYQRKLISTGEDVGEPGPLPRELMGLRDESLADLPAALGEEFAAANGWADTGYLPVADPEPAAPRWIHKALFKRRFTAQERIAIRAASASDPVLFDFMDVLDTTEQVFLDDAELIQGLGYLVLLNLLGSGRMAQIRE